MSSPPVSVGNPTSFSQVVNAFQNVGNDKHVRFQDSKGLYESNKGSLTAIKAFFGNKEAIAMREQKRSDGAAKLVSLIAHEYGPDIANRALMHMRLEGHDLSKGMTVGQMKYLDHMITTSLNNQAMVQQGFGRNGALFKADLQSDYNEKFDRPKHYETLATNIATTLNIDPAKINLSELKTEFAKLEGRNQLTERFMTLEVIQSFADGAARSGDVEDVVSAASLLVGYYAQKASEEKIARPNENPIGNFMRGSEGKAINDAARPHFKGAVDALMLRMDGVQDVDFKVEINKVAPNASPQEIAEHQAIATKSAEFLDEAFGKLFGGSDAASGTVAAYLVSDEGARVFAAAIDAARAEGNAVDGAFANRIAENTTADVFVLRHLNPAIFNAAKALPAGDAHTALMAVSKTLQLLANHLVVGNDKLAPEVQAVLAKYQPVLDAFNAALLARGQQLNA